MKALETEVDSMGSLLEVLHQNSISLRDPQAVADELDTIVRQSEDSERVVREMEALLRSDMAAWGPELGPETATRLPEPGSAPQAGPVREKVKRR